MLWKCLIFMLVTLLMTGAQCEVMEVFAEAGSQAVLPCKCSPTLHASPAVIWSKADKGIVWRKEKSGLQHWGARWTLGGFQRVHCPHSQFERGDFSLQIDNVKEEDGGNYFCTVEVGGRVAENMVTLRIITVSISPMDPTIGMDISVTCDVTPKAHGTSVHWMVNNNTILPQTQITSNRDTSKSIVMEKAAVRLAGTWTCVVGYKGKEERASATLSVKGIIQPPTDNTKVYAAVGTDVTLPCVFSAGLMPSSPLWEKQLPESPLNQHRSFSPSSQSSHLAWDKSVSLQEVGFKDEGRYRCSGTVQGQVLSRTIQLVVAKVDSQVLSKRKGSLMLTCQLSDTSEVTEYEWVHVTYDLNGTQSFGSIQKGKTLSISQMSEDHLGTWTCRFFGKSGILGNITYDVQMMSGLSGQKSPGSSLNTAAVVGLSFLLFVMLLILAQMCKNYQRKKRIFQYPALETIVHTISTERERRERNQAKHKGTLN